ncbi:TPA: helix-turn-helix transcriptional regulator [Morganella morganii]|nr:helix-turn-helix transcriptional regulator [Morganella morganii]
MNKKTNKEDVVLYKTIGNSIKERRKELGYSGAEMGRLLKVSQQQYSRYERGESMISAITLFKISDILKYPICLFLNDHAPLCLDEEFTICMFKNT